MNLQELIDFIQQYDSWVYAMLFVYCTGKTGPLPMVAGFAAAQGALRLDLVLLGCLLGSMVGGQIRFALGRFAFGWVCRTFPKAAPWLALASAGVERYSFRVLLSYRFVKGSFSLVGLGAGASLLAWPRHVLVDSVGALLWVGSFVAVGLAFGNLGAALDPRWAAYVGLSLLVISFAVLALFRQKIISKLQPLAEQTLRERTARTVLTAQ